MQGESIPLQQAIDEIFEGKAFERPLFYKYPGGLRFELSEGGTAIEQFLTAMKKSRAICEDIFDTEGALVACLRVPSRPHPFAHRSVLAQLKGAGIRIPAARAIWCEPIAGPDWSFDEGERGWWINVAFRAPQALLPSFLWCAMAADLGSIRPRPFCSTYLFHLERRVMVWPYDDRGMDVVGPNREFLAQLYRTHHHHLLDHDRASMEETFGPPPQLGNP